VTVVIFLSTFWDVLWASFIVFFIIMPLIMLWVFALADLFRRKGMSAVSRVIWLLVIIWLPILGPLTYLLVRPAPEDVAYR
jgi:hypothetical protein